MSTEVPDSGVLFAAPITHWTVVDDGDATLTVPIAPAYQGVIAAAVADPDLNVVIGVLAVPKTPEEPA